ncbi:MAG: hypothetical protein NUW37_15970, partial [Planctomycetes bacterium]|nr:hypothetical protein [Planctomycetota bacterium]
MEINADGDVRDPGNSPHPSFGHLLPNGEGIKETIMAANLRQFFFDLSKAPVNTSVYIRGTTL